jgi:hypothetical protein
MKLILPLTCFLFLFLLTINKVAANAHWELELDKEGIRVYTQLDENSPYKQIKVITTINAPLERVMDILLDFSDYEEWMNDVDESYLLNKLDSNYYVFIHEDVAWPMQNRYQVSKMSIQKALSRAKVRFKSVPNFIEKRTDAIQIKQFEGYWELDGRITHQCTLEYVLIQNPGGYVPPWMTNLYAIENPFNSVHKLKKMAEDSVITP